ncbi:MAG: efflux RND transporter permease subunit [Candidatus Hadarchaeia archaeon]
MVEALTEASKKRPYVVLLIVLLVSGGMAYGVSKITMTSEMEKFLPEEFASVKVTNRVENALGGTVSEHVLIRNEDVGSAESFRSILILQSRIENRFMRDRSSREGEYILRMVSYPQIVVNSLEDRGVDWRSLSDAQLEQAIQQILDSDEGLEDIVLENREATVISITINSELAQDNLYDYTDELNEIVKDFDDSQKSLSAEMTGSISMEMETQNMMNRDNRILIPAAGLLIIVILFLAFRKITDVAFPFLILLLGALWMVGTMGLLDISFTMVYVALVPVILGVGIDYTIHMLNRYYEERGLGLAVEKASVRAVRTVGVAVALTAVTTIVGFASFGVSEMPPIRNFGFLAASGVFYIFILATTLLPSLVVLRDRGKKKLEPSPEEKDQGIDRIGLALSKLVTGIRRHGKPIIAAVIIVSAASAVFSTGLSTTMALDTFLPDDADSVQTMNEMEALFGGQTMSNYVLVTGNYSNPESLRAIRDYQSAVMSDSKSSGLITESRSLLDLFPSVEIPDDPQQISLILENAKGTTEAARFFVGDGTLIHFSVLSESDKQMREATDIMRNHVRGIDDEGDVTFNVEGDPAVGGGPAIISDVMESILPDMRNSVILAILLVIVVLGLVFRSATVGLIGSIPVLIALSWELGVMRSVGWSLDVMNMMVSALAIGIGVDFTIHVTHRFHEEWKKDGKTPEEAIAITIERVGRAVVAAAATTIGAFIVLSLSSMPPVTRFGQLAAMVIFFALVGSLVVLPTVLLGFARWKDGRGRE